MLNLERGRGKGPDERYGLWPIDALAGEKDPNCSSN
jgi:hypothetical protein